MKSIKIIIATVIVILTVMAVGTHTALAAPAPEADFTFNSGSGTITGYNGPGGDVEIPATIGGVSVTAIGYRAFLLKESVTSVIIPEGVTSIGESAFHACSALTSVTIPNSVTTVGNYAFASCGNLTSVTIPNSVTTIGSFAFASCGNLTDINIPGSVTSIGDYAFEYCGKLSSMIIPDGVTSISRNTFKNCGSLTSITIPSGVTSIGEGAFQFCGSLTSITIPDGVTSIDQYVFQASGLTSIIIPSSITTIGGYAFQSCGNLTSINIPGSVTTIGSDAFSSCIRLTGITIVDGVTSIGGSAFFNCNGLTSVIIPNSVTTIGSNAFADCDNLANINISGSVTSIGEGAFQNCGKLSSMTIPDGVTSISQSTFRNCSSLVSINIPVSVTTIGGYAFQGCSSLAGITIPDGVTVIDGYAFQGCSKLSGITIPNSVTSISQYTFDGCSKLASITIPDGVTGIGGYAFQGCSTLSGITIPNSVTVIEVNTFKGCSNLASITIPDGVTSIGDAAFYGCYKLSGITIPNGVTSIGGVAFYCCSGLTSINIPGSVTSIGFGAFYGCYSLTGIIIPDGVTSIGERAFYGCSSLASITIPDSVTSIGMQAFAFCSSLTKARFMGNAPTMGTGVFTGCAASFKVYYFRDKTGYAGDAGGTWNGCNAFPLVSVTYDANDSSGGSVPVDGALYEQGQNVTVWGNTGGLVHPNAAYTFVGWNTAADGSGDGYTGGDTFAVAGGSDITLYALWRQVYTVTWMPQGGGEPYDTDTVIAGLKPVFGNSVPIKADTAQYDYEFAGWATSPGQTTGTLEASLPVVSGNTTYYAAFSETLRTYIVTWKSQDGSTKLEEDSTPYGLQPGFGLANPLKADTAQYDYTFAGWATSANQTSGTSKDSLPAVTGNTTYYAAFSETLKTYIVTWKSQDGLSTLEEDNAVPYGSAPSFDGANPEKADTAQYDYGFVGWATSADQTAGIAEASLPAVTGTATYYAAFSQTVRNYTVTFDSNGGSTISSQSINYSDTSAEPAEPTKDGHTFAGWYTDNGLNSAYNFTTPITASITLYAKWTVNTYTVTWKSQDGSTILEEDNTSYGLQPGFGLANPVKADTAQYDYEFVGWTTSPDQTTGTLEASLPAVSGNTTYYAAFSETLKNYIVIWKSQDGSTILEEDNTPYGLQPGFGLASPVKADTAQYDYEFVGWTTSPDQTTGILEATLPAVSGNTTYYAAFSETLKNYIVTWKSQDGNTILEADTDVPYGSKPSFDTANPEKTDTAQYDYTFAGWATSMGQTTGTAEDSLPAVTGTATYYASFSETPQTYTVTYNYNYESKGPYTTQTIPYGSNLTAPATAPVRSDYTFAGWYKETDCATPWDFKIDTIIGATDLYAKWTAKTPVSISEAAQTYQYDGTAKAFKIIGTPAEGFTITYTPGSDLIEPGGYGVEITRDEDATYASYSISISNGLVITPIVISNAAIDGVTPPVRGAVPVSALPGTDEYTAQILWSPADAVFAPNTVYTAGIRLIPKTGYTLFGVPENFFTVAGAAPTSNSANSDIITAVFPATEAKPPVSSGGDGSETPSTPKYNAVVKAGNGIETTHPVTVNKDSRSASVDAGSQMLISGGAVITVPSIPDVDTYTLGIPVPYLSMPDEKGALTVNTGTGSISVPSNMLTGVSGISGSKADITIGLGDKGSLPDTVKAAIGDKPLIQLTLSIDGKQTDWSNPDTPVTVSIPYTPTAAELANPESIVVWYIDGSGNVVTIPNGHYDPAIGMVTFETTHFSDYAVAYNKVSFSDVAPGAWYNKAVNFIAAREITGGTGNGNFSPDVKLTRGDFLVLLMNACAIAPDNNPKGNFSDAGSTYYTGYLASAKRLGITGGVGNNMYAPKKEITRQEMFTLLYNALKVIGKLPEGDSGRTLSDFSDAGQIDSWAEEAMTLLTETGTISGNAGKLTPTSTTTRAEMAQVLYNLLTK